MKNWKTIPNYSLYQASEDGEIKTFNWKNTGQTRIMKPAFDNCGYLRTMIKNDNGKFDTIKVHRIIAQTFIPNPENKPQVNHKNGIKSDNSIDNLEWSTVSENIRHSFDSGFHPSRKGENNPSAKISEREVLEIRALYIPSKGGKIKDRLTKSQIAEMYKVSVSLIKRIVTNQTWNHL